MSLASNIHELLMGGSSSGYSIANSLRFRASASAYLNRTPSVAGNRQTWTLSCWLKRGAIGVTYAPIFAAGSSGSAYSAVWFHNDVIEIYSYNGSTQYFLGTNQVFRDPSSWYHIVLSIDTTQATSSNRIKLYVNGNQVTSFSSATYPSQNYSDYFDSTSPHYFGQFTPALGSYYFDGYLTEVNFIDGQALTPSSFGEIDSTTGVWKAKRYTGTYGTNGFKLNFSNGTSTTTLGYDSSGNGNNWTTNNISLTAGSTYDWMIDSPTKFPGSSYGVGNYAVLNPLSNVGTTITNGNLTVDTGISNGYYVLGSIAIPSTGKWYWEYTPTVNGALSLCGIWVGLGKYVTYFGADGDKYVDGVASAYGAAYTDNDVIGVAVNADSGSVTFYKNNSSQGAITYTVAGYFPYFADGTGGSGTTLQVNFGQRPFAYTPPSGYKSLCTQNLPGVTIQNGAQYMAATLFTETGSAQTINNAVNGVSFQPDLVWQKARSEVASHRLIDSVRGTGKVIYSNLTNVEATESGVVDSFTSTGYVGAGPTVVATTGGTGVAWQWKAGGTAVTNTAGSITSSVSANPTAGFSVVTYTGTGANATVGHGLGVAPSMMILKNRSSGSFSWAVYHASLANASTTLELNNTSAADGSNATTFNATAPTSSVISLGVNDRVNKSADTYVAYCFAAIPGYSAFGSYTGNGSTDGPFIFTGFRPRYVMIKRTDTSGGSWVLHDSSRDNYNSSSNIELYAEAASVEAANGRGPDLLSNGFKQRNNTFDYNASSGTYIYAAFAENPFQYSLAR